MIDTRQGQYSYSYVDTENAFQVIYLSCPLGKVKASKADIYVNIRQDHETPQTKMPFYLS